MLKIKSLTALIVIAILSFALAAFGAVFTTAQAAESVTTVNEAGLEISDNVLTGLKDADSLSGNVKVVVPDGVTSIGENALRRQDEQNYSIVEVELPASLTSIGNYAFTNTRISSVNIPANVTEIGEHAFHGCTSLTSVTFAKRTEALLIKVWSFAGCAALKTIDLPANTTVNQFAFDGCTSLLWVYVGAGANFSSSAGNESVTYFPSNTQVAIVFSSAAAYNQALSRADQTFKNSHEAIATYVVNVNCYVGSATTPNVYERLHGRNFNYVKDGDSSSWSVDTAYSDLPVQDAKYASTTWYSEKEFKNTVSYADVNALLNGASDEINLYCHETVLAPAFPEEPTSWVYSDDISYDINDKAQVLKALGCEQTFTDTQLAAMDFNVKFANEKGEPADTPDKIQGNGVYSVTITLNAAYGSWVQTVNPSLTVNIDTTGFNIVLIVFLVLGIIGMVATASTAIIRKKIQDRNKRKQISQKEILERYKAAGGETTIIK